MTRTQVFISYSHRDQVWLERLQTVLSPVVRSQEIVLWDDTRIRAGADWQGEIDAALAATKVAVLLVTPDFLASEFIARHELPPILDAAMHAGVQMLWVPVKASLYKSTPIATYKSTIEPTRPLEAMRVAARNQTLVRIAEMILAALAEPTPISPTPMTRQLIERPSDGSPSTAAARAPLAIVEHPGGVGAAAPVSATTRTAERLAPLAAAEERADRLIQTQARYMIDRVKLIECDLRAQMAQYETHLRSVGAFSYTLDGDFEIIERYVLERIKHRTRLEEDRESWVRDLHVYRSESLDPEAGVLELKQQLWDQYTCRTLVDLFEDRRYLDVFLVIWNHRCPTIEMQAIASRFWERETPALATCLETRHCRLITFWINEQDGPFEGGGFYVIPPLTTLPMKDEVVPWFEHRLDRAGVPCEVIEKCIKRLQRHQGHPPGTWREMENIVRELGGRAG